MERVPARLARTTFAPGSVLLGRFRIDGLVGRGSAAEVLGALDEHEGGRVVVKVPKDECLKRPLERERFRRETTFLMRLVHPGVVRMLAAGEERGIAFAVLAHLPGGSLLDRMRPPDAPAGRAIELDRLAGPLLDVAGALDHIHAEGVLHRDLKPTNVLFDAAGAALVSDFGLAKAIHGESSLTPKGLAVGTPAYLAPEQIRDLRLTARCDQYALAVMMYEALSGRTPFSGESLGRLLLQKSRGDAPSLALAAPNAAPHVVAAVDRALRRDAAARFATCLEFARALLGEA